MSCERFVAAAIGVVVIGGVARGAHAYELQVTAEGAPVRWHEDEVAFDLSGLDAAPQAEGAVVAAAQRALETWSTAGGPVLVEGAAQPGAVAATIRWAAEAGDPGVSPDNLAETHLAYDVDTGALVRANIVVNGAAFRWATGDDDTCAAAFDLESTLAHELGHALGLKHSAVEEATMYTRPAPCARDRRDLASDDLEGVADLYAEPPHAGPEASTGAGCSAAGGNSSTVMWLLLVAAVMLARSRFFMRG